MLDIMEISPQDEAERLWQGAREAFSESEENLVRLCEAIDLGIRAVEILVVLKLQGVRREFPGSIAMLLESPKPEVDFERDALSVPATLTFLDMIDMLSVDSLECVSRKLHHGWEDRSCACRRARARARATLGISLDAGRRDELLKLEAYRNRIFRMPPPVRIVPAEIAEAFPALTWFYQGLTMPLAA